MDEQNDTIFFLFFASTKEKSADEIYLNFQRCTRRELKRSGQKACKRKLGQQPRTATRSLDHPSHDEATQLACSSGHPIWQAMHKRPLLTRREILQQIVQRPGYISEELANL